MYYHDIYSRTERKVVQAIQPWTIWGHGGQIHLEHHLCSRGSNERRQKGSPEQPQHLFSHRLGRSSPPSTQRVRWQHIRSSQHRLEPERALLLFLWVGFQAWGERHLLAWWSRFCQFVHLPRHLVILASQFVFTPNWHSLINK